jgi:hypothetical protein
MAAWLLSQITRGRKAIKTASGIEKFLRSLFSMTIKAINIKLVLIETAPCIEKLKTIYFYVHLCSIFSGVDTPRLLNWREVYAHGYNYYLI